MISRLVSTRVSLCLPSTGFSFIMISRFVSLCLPSTGSCVVMLSSSPVWMLVSLWFPSKFIAQGSIFIMVWRSVLLCLPHIFGRDMIWNQNSQACRMWERLFGVDAGVILWLFPLHFLNGFCRFLQGVCWNIHVLQHLRAFGALDLPDAELGARRWNECPHRKPTQNSKRALFFRWYLKLHSIDFLLYYYMFTWRRFPRIHFLLKNILLVGLTTWCQTAPTVLEQLCFSGRAWSVVLWRWGFVLRFCYAWERYDPFLGRF